MSRLGEELPVVRDGTNLVSRDGKELPGLWEFWEKDGLAACMCG